MTCSLKLHFLEICYINDNIVSFLEKKEYVSWMDKIILVTHTKL